MSCTEQRRLAALCGAGSWAAIPMSKTRSPGAPLIAAGPRDRLSTETFEALTIAAAHYLRLKADGPVIVGLTTGKASNLLNFRWRCRP